MKKTVLLAVLTIATASLAVRSQDARTATSDLDSRLAAGVVTQLEPAKPLPEVPVAKQYTYRDTYRADFSPRYETRKLVAPQFEKLADISPKQLDVPDLPAETLPDLPKEESAGFNWSDAMQQSLVFLAIQHGYAVGGQSKTRKALKGPFLRDYFDSVKSLGGWSDGGKLFTNYVAHPMQGSFMGFIQVQNDPRGKGLRISNSPAYWKSRAKAFAWSAAWSTQFELGPVSQASIGNVGLKGKQTYVDIVVTPTVGTLMLVTEDALDQYLIRRLENWTKNPYVRIFARMLLNPTRTIANVFRFELPWHRDRGLR
jgi:hypothetical protein